MTTIPIGKGTVCKTVVRGSTPRVVSNLEGAEVGSSSDLECRRDALAAFIVRCDRLPPMESAADGEASSFENCGDAVRGPGIDTSTFRHGSCPAWTRNPV